jgi:hypothetical protein
MATAVRRSNTDGIAQCGMSRATPEATGRRHRATTCSLLPQRLPGQQANKQQSTNTKSDLDKTSSLEGIFIQILDNTLSLIVDDEVVGDESLDNHFTRWISVIDFILSGLAIFAQARSM